ncbi:MAG: CDP-alcohol phosphatidyltransferase family protein [Defluviitaleaceae bacterium]|nr:CDP-alcohol phosphatidyltransferase family protein [Defluviitaleaceae bacterium]
MRNTTSLMKYTPNILSSLRIILTISLIFLEPLALPFMIVYFLAVFSDIIDGPIARRAAVTSQLGAALDGFADFFLIIVVLFRVWPLIEFSNWIGIWIISLIILKMVSAFIGYLKYKKLVLLHTYANKFFVLVLSTFPVLEVLIDNSNIWLAVFCIIGSLAILEDILINLTSKQLDLDIKGLFFK